MLMFILPCRKGDGLEFKDVIETGKEKCLRNNSSLEQGMFIFTRLVIITMIDTSEWEFSLIHGILLAYSMCSSLFNVYVFIKLFMMVMITVYILPNCLDGFGTLDYLIFANKLGKLKLSL